MKQIALYPGTFDPITLGHQDLVKRVCYLFDEVILVVADNAAKRSLFSIDERIEQISKIYQTSHQITVYKLEGLIADLACELNAKSIIRGLRTMSDFDYELQMATMNRQFNNKVETLFLTPDSDFNYISSSIVKEIATLGGDISTFVEPDIKEALKAKIKAYKA